MSSSCVLKCEKEYEEVVADHADKKNERKGLWGEAEQVYSQNILSIFQFFSHTTVPCNLLLRKRDRLNKLDDKGFLQLIWPILQNSEEKFHGAHLWAVCDVQASLAEPDVDEESDAH